MDKKTYLKLRIIPVAVIIMSLFVIGYNLINKEQLPYDPDERFSEEEPFYYTDEKAETGVVNINTAGKWELETLPNIGTETAEKIIELREKTGGFTSERQLLHIEGISDSRFEEILPYITAD